MRHGEISPHICFALRSQIMIAGSRRIHTAPVTAEMGKRECLSIGSTHRDNISPLMYGSESSAEFHRQPAPTGEALAHTRAAKRDGGYLEYLAGPAPPPRPAALRCETSQSAIVNRSECSIPLRWIIDPLVDARLICRQACARSWIDLISEVGRAFLVGLWASERQFPSLHFNR
jgi:hypothetical protein